MITTYTTMMIPTTTTGSGTHWRKWPGRVACGGEALTEPQPQSPQAITCEACQQLVASWHPGTRYELVGANVPIRRDMLQEVGIESTVFATWAEAHEALKLARRRAFHLRKRMGVIPTFTLRLNTTQTKRPHRFEQMVPVNP